MAETTYNYDVTADLPDGKVNPSRLQIAIEASAIVTALARIETSGGSINLGVVTGGALAVTFKDALSAGDKTLLDGDATAPAGGLLASTSNDPTQSQPAMTEDGILLAQDQVQTLGWQLCDRDIKITTCTVDVAAASEDLKPDLTTFMEEEWDECALVAVYKLNGTSDAMIPVDDQADADVNGTLTIWDYCAKDQSADPKTQVPYDIRDGGLIVDDAIPANERFSHRAYAIGAPGLAAYGMAVRFFDGYLAAQPDHRIEAKSPQAKRMPADVSPPAGVMRIMIYHPAGSQRSHILRLVTYRPLGTF